MTNKPVIRASFELDGQGRPTFQKEGMKHYHIQLHVDGAPKDTYAVTYFLHESYYEPVREARNPGSSFAEELTSYGDFTVQAKIRTREGITTIAAPLSDALETAYKGSATPEIKAALNDIRDN